MDISTLTADTLNHNVFKEQIVGLIKRYQTIIDDNATDNSTLKWINEELEQLSTWLTALNDIDITITYQNLQEQLQKSQFKYDEFVSTLNTKLQDITTTFQTKENEIIETFSQLENFKGPQGIQGLKGDKGDQGPQGIQGLKGDKGDQGVQGLKGDKGDQGPQGIQGLKGDKGEVTFQSLTPEQVQSLRGDKGDQGIQGIKGDQGIQGLKGDKGDQGPHGIKGDNGKDGLTPKGTVLQLVSHLTSVQSSQTINQGVETLVNDLTKTVIPKGNNSKFLITVRWFGEVSDPSNFIFNIHANGSRINSSTSLKQALSMPSIIFHIDNDSTPEISAFSTFYTSASVLGEPIKFDLVCLSTTGNQTLWNNRSFNSSTSLFYEHGSSEIIIMEIGE